jgi:periplasmic copper chaperone A
MLSLAHAAPATGFMNLRPKMKNLSCAVMAFTLGVLPVIAKEFQTGNLVIADPWAPPGIGQQRIGAVYFSIRNQGLTPERLQAVELPDGGRAMLHSSTMQDGIMRMRPLDAIEIPAGAEVALLPGATHVMLTDLPGPLLKESSLRLVLRFEQAGSVEVLATVRSRPVTQAPPSSHPGH